MLNEVAFFQVHALHAFAAAFLLTIGGYGQTLDIACLRNGNCNLFFSNEVFDIELFHRTRDLRLARSGITALDLEQFVFDDPVDHVRIIQELLVIGDRLAQLSKFILDLLALESGQTAQAHLKDRFALFF